MKLSPVSHPFLYVVGWSRANFGSLDMDQERLTTQEAVTVFLSVSVRKSHVICTVTHIEANDVHLVHAGIKVPQDRQHGV